MLWIKERCHLRLGYLLFAYNCCWIFTCPCYILEYGPFVPRDEGCKFIYVTYHTLIIKRKIIPFSLVLVLCCLGWATGIAFDMLYSLGFIVTSLPVSYIQNYCRRPTEIQKYTYSGEQKVNRNRTSTLYLYSYFPSRKDTVSIPFLLAVQRCDLIWYLHLIVTIA